MKKTMWIALGEGNASILPKGTLVCHLDFDPSIPLADQLDRYGYPAAMLLFATLEKRTVTSPQGDGAGE